LFFRVHIPSILGDDSFVDNITEKYFKEKQDQEVPESKVLAPDIERIKQAVCSQYRTNPDDLLVSRRGTENEARNVAIYLIRQYTGEKLVSIGHEFNISKYSTVSSVVLKVGNELHSQKDEKFKKQINDIKKTLGKGQRQT